MNASSVALLREMRDLKEQVAISNSLNITGGSANQAPPLNPPEYTSLEIILIDIYQKSNALAAQHDLKFDDNNNLVAL